MWCITATIDITPMRLATKLGVSLARTMLLPSRLVSQASRSSSIAGWVRAVAISSTSAM